MANWMADTRDAMRLALQNDQAISGLMGNGTWYLFTGQPPLTRVEILSARCPIILLASQGHDSTDMAHAPCLRDSFDVLFQLVTSDDKPQCAGLGGVEALYLAFDAALRASVSNGDFDAIRGAQFARIEPREVKFGHSGQTKEDPRPVWDVSGTLRVHFEFAW